MKKVTTAFIAAALMTACGGSSGPTQPSTPNVSSISITNTETRLFVGATMNLNAQATMSNGTTQTITGCSWGGDTPAAGTVSGSGVATGVHGGDVTFWCDYQGQRATKRIHVLPNYAGSYQGSYTIEGCTADRFFALARICDNFTVQKVFPLSLDIQQTNETLTMRTSLGQLDSDMATATLRGDGSVQVDARYHGNGNTIRQTWNIDSDVPSRITGKLDQWWENDSYYGEAHIWAHLYNTNRQLTQRALAPGGVAPRDLQDMLRAVAIP